jgi:hypothetical protein
VSDPGGRLGPGPRLRVAGAILSRWQVDERDGVLRVISQRGAGRTGNGLAYPEVETFRIEGARSFTTLGRMTLDLPYQEGLRAVRFDRHRAYAITYFQTDPLFVIDLSDPASPVQRGELEMPGFMFHLEPHGDRLLGLGVDRTDPSGSLNVSLFDVSDADAPAMIERVSFAAVGVTEDYQILDTEVAEDQDRIQKAFRLFENGLIVVPFSNLQPYGATGDCANQGGGVQLVEWTEDTLVERALLPLPGNPRRALPHGDELVVLSDSHVRAYALADTARAVQTAELVIGECVPRTSPGYSPNGQPGAYDDYHCSAGSGRASAGSLLVVLALVAVARRRPVRPQSIRA